ncbi:hypothetical protein GB2207_03167 [marine gamma proteobacterium HTCC2207]|jgi:hypothetical protein|uniref:Uncharacterized protein n=1 Tax=gamma proteobacterium HTCC2207 TaxID=314287 RepID=Q1YP15_9GAMM|nr:hypothetical protein GB2207_03167 [marine gamma proteobacterium HTCC2207] [gamma proteobacterium HTCC2207]MBT5104745.1 hypothetical protein [Porticoccaceae bacterium]MBT6114796.1 hypothetical protein [Porticoccaceae bacterium]
MSLFKKRAQKRAADAAAAESTPLAKLSTSPAAKLADEPPVKFSAALAARLSGEAQVQPALAPLIENPKGLSWEIWYAKFKTVATLGNPRLQLQGADENIIDLMDHQPLREAFNSAIDPTQLGEQFASDFDVGAFLRNNGVFK